MGKRLVCGWTEIEVNRQTQIDTTHYDMDSLLVEVDGDIVRISDSEDMLEMSKEMLRAVFDFAAGRTK
jgi:hypothetical protein